MFSKILILLLTMLATSTTAHATDIPSPEQVVAVFQKVPHYEMFCQDESWGNAEPIKIGEKFKVYFSKEFYKLFLWAQCGQPEMPPHYGELYSMFYYDIRFSIHERELELENTYLAKDILIQRKKINEPYKAILGVHFTYRKTKMFTSYTLIQEDGQWKIDDIAPQADYVKDSDMDTYDHSDSIKTDMQNNYRAAEDRYKQEQAKKH